MNEPSQAPREPQTVFPVAELLVTARTCASDDVTQTLTSLRNELDNADPGTALVHARQLAHHANNLVGLLADAHKRESFERGWRAALAPEPGQFTMRDWYTEVAELMTQFSATSDTPKEEPPRA